MKNKVTYKEEPNLFNDIEEFEIDRIQDHRKGSAFYLQFIIELKLEDKEYFKEVENFEQYLGTWKTNQIIWSDVYSSDEEVSILTRVEKKETITYTWKEV